MKEVEIFTDGACSGNPGPGGWGALLRYKNTEKALCGGEENTTNNRMELFAVIAALSALKEQCRAVITTDSQYVVNGIENGWAEKWRQNGWQKKDRSPILNRDLWEKLLELCQLHSVTFIWVRGHAGHPENERCDRMAVEYYTSHFLR